MDHLSENTLAQLMEGQLADEPMQQVQRHIDVCPECRRLVGELARDAPSAVTNASGWHPTHTPDIVAPEAPLATPVSDPLSPRSASELVSCTGCGARCFPGETRCSRCGKAVELPDPVTGPDGPPLLDGKWLLGPELGRGGMGTVHLGTDVALERTVAIKLMSSALKSHPEAIVRFEREARMLAKLEHPNLVPIYAVGRKDGLPFIVMKHLGGITLSEHLRQVGRVAPETGLEIVRQLCAGLDFIHSRGIIHRDIKPSNIFLAPDGHVTILDLGVAHDTQNQLTRSGALVGTPRYMSPEQIVLGSGRIDRRSDLYALATVTYEMLTGTRVFEAESDFSVMRAHADAAPPNAHDKCPEVPRALGQVLKQALEKNPHDRFATCGEFLVAFEAALLPDAKTGLDLTPRHAALTVGTPGRARPAASNTPEPTTDRQSDPRTFVPPSAQSDSGLERAAGLRPRRRRVRMIVAALGLMALGTGVTVFGLLESGPTPMVATRDATDLPSASQVAKVPQVPTGVVPEPVRAEVEPPVATPAAVEKTGQEAEPAATASASGARRVRPPATAPRETSKRSRKPTRDAERPSVIAASAASAASATPATASVGIVSVATTSSGKKTWAWLEVDGIRQPNATPTTLELAPGSYRIRALRDRHGTAIRDIEVKPGEQVRLQLELLK